jgi:signal transduction histidine kinase/DNA-binding response OmpR family regulator
LKFTGYFKPPGFMHMPIRCILEKDRKLLMGTWGYGLIEFDPATWAHTQFKYNFEKTVFTTRNIVASFFRIGDTLLVGTVDKGVGLFDLGTSSFVFPDSPSADGSGWSKQWVECMFQDRTGILWFGTMNGLYKYDALANKFKTFRIPNPEPSLKPIHITRVVANRADPSGAVYWVASRSHGLYKVSGSNGRALNFTFPLNPEKGVTQNSISDMILDAEGDLVLATLDGVRVISTVTHRMKRYNARLTGISTPSDSIFRCMLQLDKDRFLLGTERALALFDKRSGRIESRESFPRGSGRRIDDIVFSLARDSNGDIWVGTQHIGICRLNSTLDSIRYYGTRQGYEGTAYSILQDSRGVVWVTSEHGLYTYNPSRDIFEKFRAEKYISDDPVFSIAEDAKGRLWISGANELYRLDPLTGRIQNYSSTDGLFGGNITSLGACGNGEFYVGFNGAFNIFDPLLIRGNPVLPDVKLTGLRTPDRSFTKLPRSGGAIKLSHEENTISLEFVGLNFSNSSRNEYAYIMEGLDEKWFYCGTRKAVTYSHLPPGEYVFKVKASNDDGRWNENPYSLTVSVAPPWWKTTWAYAGYALAILGILYTIRRSEKNRDRLRHRMELEHVEAEKLREVDQLKSRFFANISHEFRTPLTLILGPIQKWKTRGSPDIYVGDERKQTHTPGEGFEPLIARSAGELSQDMALMERNANRLLRLINQLLDLSKLESGAMKLRASRGNIVPFVKGIASSFESSAGMRGIKVTTESDAEEIEAYFDRDKLEKILTNLLSNAFKFTPDGGCVTVQIRNPKSEIRNHIELSVIDTGIGIPAYELPRVFDRFYQVDQSQTREYEGSGIGLALTKELVELHHGTTSVRSEVGKGTEFTVSLPLGREHLKDDEVITTEETKQQVIPTSPVGAIRESPLREETEEVVADKSLPIVLIIEDNADVRAYMKEYLVRSYQVLEAHDGAEGVEKAEETIPDLIISDVMMPKKDGYEVCKTLKLDEKTSHIPIILLTARAGTENKIEGLETGADDYLTKPFDAKELLARVKNLIEQRRRLRERFRGEVILKPKDIAITSADEKFLTKLMALLEAHISESDFDTETIASELTMSRMQLHRKVRALTDSSPREFLRKMRVERATELLRKHAGNISEVAYEVGFANPAHFAQVFRTLKGVTPSEFLEKEESSHKPMQ